MAKYSSKLTLTRKPILKIHFAQQPFEKSIFLAGPTPRLSRDPKVPTVLSWRPKACGILEELEFEGTVLVPESEGFVLAGDYDVQVPWEWEGLNLATVVVFWVDRHLVTMPGFITNVEFGLLVASGKAVLGCPEDAPKMTYLHKLAKRFNVPIFGSLPETLAEAVRITKLPFGEKC